MDIWTHIQLAKVEYEMGVRSKADFVKILNEFYEAVR